MCDERGFARFSMGVWVVDRRGFARFSVGCRRVIGEAAGEEDFAGLAAFCRGYVTRSVKR